MDVKYIKTIDLTEYGAEGTIEMRFPTFRKLTQLRNWRSRQVRIRSGRGQAGRDIQAEAELDEADFEIMAILAYIYKAPFEQTISGYMAFMDGIDALDDGENVGAAQALHARIMEEVSALDEAGTPFGNLQVAEMTDSA